MDDPGSSPSVCPTCGAEAPESARFCGRCGTRIEGDEAAVTGEAPADSQAYEPVAFARAERRVFGVAAPELLFGLALFVLVLAVFFLVSGRWVVGAVLLIVAAGLAWFFVSASRTLPDGRLAQAAVGVSDGARSRAGFAWVSLASWSHAGREVVRLRALQHRLRRERDELVRGLGDAVHRGDEERAETLKAEARACEDRIEECERQLHLALEAARERVDRERITIQPTQVKH